MVINAAIVNMCSVVVVRIRLNIYIRQIAWLHTYILFLIDLLIDTQFLNLFRASCWFLTAAPSFVYSSS